MNLEGLLVLLGLIVLAIPVAVLYLLISHSGVKGEVRELKAELARLRNSLKAGELSPDQAPVAQKATPPASRKSDAPPLPMDVAPSVATPKNTGQPETPKPAPAPQPEATPSAFVFRGDRVNDLLDWLKENWFYAIAALSLALSGIFLVQYGVEKGLLSPPLRVVAALALGAALIGVGEWLRRRGGDEADDLTAFLPSTFAGGGLVTMFAGIVAARQLYGLIGAEMAFFGLLGVGVLAIGLGWFYGAFLTAIGLIGATAAPFVLGGSNSDPSPLNYYFALVALVGLAIDAMKRTAWLSVLALALGFSAVIYLYLHTGNALHLLAFALITTAGAATLPMLSLWPHHSGQLTLVSLGDGGKNGWPEFPTRLVAGTFVATVGLAIWASEADAGGFWLSLVTLGLIYAAVVLWFRNAPALEDMIMPVALAIPAVVALQGVLSLDAFSAFKYAVVEPEQSPPMTITVLTGLGLAGSLLAAFRSFRGAAYPILWAGLAALFAPAMVVILELLWGPTPRIDTYSWAFHVLSVAVVMTLLAERAARIDGEDRTRVAFFALAALTMISFVLTLLLTKTALTLALAVMVVAAATLDRRYGIKPLTYFVQIGGAICSYRLIADPGIFWALETGWLEMSLGFIGVIALFAVAWVILLEKERVGAIVVMESAVFSLSGIFASVLLFRALDDFVQPDAVHWPLGLFALIWLISAATQAYRMKAGGALRLLRVILAGAFGAIGLISLGLAILIFSPLVGFMGEVGGPPVVDTLLLAYFLPALLLAAVAAKFTHLPGPLRIGLAGVAAVSAAFYVGLEIRRLWQGRDLSGNEVLDGELYSYTIAMLLVSAGLLVLALLRRSALLRKMAVVAVGLTVAKVFLIDMSGLAGLIRVFSFLALGLSLGALAWLNRWIMTQEKADEAGPQGEAPV